MPTKSWKNHPQKLLRIPQIHFFPYCPVLPKWPQKKNSVFKMWLIESLSIALGLKLCKLRTDFIKRLMRKNMNNIILLRCAFHNPFWHEMGHEIGILSLTDYRHTETVFFSKNLKLLGLGRKIGLKFFDAFGVFSAKVSALFWHCEA